MKGKMVIFSGPSGVGKDTLLDAWIDRNPRVRRVITYTTRSPRVGEQNGVDYHFVTRERFMELVSEGAFLEHKEVHGNFYASPLKDTEKMIAEGQYAVLKIDVQGALSVIPLRPEALTIFVMPPSMDELERRIRSRDTDSPEAIDIRLKNALWEVAQSDQYRYLVVNDEIGRAVRELDEIVTRSE